jgi:hypothetical protein
MVWLIGGALASPFVPHLVTAWLASIALYLAVLLVAGIALGRRQGLGVMLRIPLVLAAIHFGFAWGFWKELARRIRGWLQLRATPLRPS